MQKYHRAARAFKALLSHHITHVPVDSGNMQDDSVLREVSSALVIIASIDVSNVQRQCITLHSQCQHNLTNTSWKFHDQ